MKKILISVIVADVEGNTMLLLPQQTGFRALAYVG